MSHAQLNNEDSAEFHYTAAVVIDDNEKYISIDEVLKAEQEEEEGEDLREILYGN